jgi:hypothetical protein
LFNLVLHSFICIVSFYFSQQSSEIGIIVLIREEMAIMPSLATRLRLPVVEVGSNLSPLKCTLVLCIILILKPFLTLWWGVEGGRFLDQREAFCSGGLTEPIACRSPHACACICIQLVSIFLGCFKITVLAAAAGLNSSCLCGLCCD